MSDYVPLPHRYRPRTWTDLVGQEVATTTLRRALLLGRVFSAYIFDGAAGCGKTTAARIFGMALNCPELAEDGSPCLKCISCKEALKGRNPDIVEIDGPSNGSVEDIRDLKQKAMYLPQGERKIFIIDEAHGVTKAGFEAFLLLLEEPPKHVVFIMATTNPEKIPDTIQSRSIKLSFKRHTEENVIARLKYIAQCESLILHHTAADLIARAADGNLRNSITELDKIVTVHPGEEITEEIVTSTLGVVSGSEVHSIMAALGAQDAVALEETLMTTLGRTTEFGLLTRALTDWFRDTLRIRMGAEQSVKRGESDLRLLRDYAKAFSPEQLDQALRITWQMSEQTRFGSSSPRTFFLTGLYRLMAVAGTNAVIAPPPSVPEPTKQQFETSTTKAAADEVPAFTAASTLDLEAELRALSEGR